MFTPLFPAAETNSSPAAPAAPAALMASSNACEFEDPLVHESLVRRTPTATAYWSPAIALATVPIPAALRILIATILLCQHTPVTPTPLSPTAAIVPAA